ncbi:hypothetical protein ACLOJK_040383 [Asimina triloba]
MREPINFSAFVTSANGYSLYLSTESAFPDFFTLHILYKCQQPHLAFVASANGFGPIIRSVIRLRGTREPFNFFSFVSFASGFSLYLFTQLAFPDFSILQILYSWSPLKAPSSVASSSSTTSSTPPPSQGIKLNAWEDEREILPFFFLPLDEREIPPFFSL